MNSKQRIHSLDMLKGAAIFLVVMGHALTMCIRGIDAAFLFKFIGEVHMPVFFFISGLLIYKPGFTRPAMGRRALQLLVPMVVMSALWVWYFPHSRLESPLPTTLPDLYADLWKGGYWFTPCLFLLIAIYWALTFALRRIGNAAARIGLIVAVYIALVITDIYAPSNLIGTRFIVNFYPIFFAGVLARQYGDTFSRAWKNPWVTAAAILIGALAFYAIAWPWELPMLPEWHYAVTKPVFHVCLIVTAFALFEPWSRSEYDTDGHTPTRPARTLSMLGRESLGIYLCHYFFLFPLGALRPAMETTGLALVPLAAVAAIVAAAVTAITLIAVRIIKTAAPLALIMIGQVPSKNKS